MCVSFASSQAVSAAPTPLALRLMTWNIRYANHGDEKAGRGWPQRRDHVFALIKSNAPDVLCVQEPLAAQVDDLTAALSDYDHFGIGRDDGERAGEFAVVFYKRDKFECLETQTVWLSPTPDVPSKGWDAVLPRIATRVRLRDRATGTTFDAWSVHYDHIGNKARLESSNLLRTRIANVTVPTIIAGDLNTIPTDPAYAAITAQGTLRDARQISESAPTGSVGTYMDWRPIKEAFGPIDYVFVSSAVRITKFDVPMRGFEQAPYPSDHLPVVTELLISIHPVE